MLKWRGRATRYRFRWAYVDGLPVPPGDKYLLVEVEKGDTVPEGAVLLCEEYYYCGDDRWCQLYAVPTDLQPIADGAAERQPIAHFDLRADLYFAARVLPFGARVGKKRILPDEVGNLAEIIRQCLPEGVETVRLLSQTGLLWIYPGWACPDWELYRECRPEECRACLGTPVWRDSD